MSSRGLSRVVTVLVLKFRLNGRPKIVVLMAFRVVWLYGRLLMNRTRQPLMRANRPFIRSLTVSVRLVVQTLRLVWLIITSFRLFVLIRGLTRLETLSRPVKLASWFRPVKAGRRFRPVIISPFRLFKLYLDSLSLVGVAPPGSGVGGR